MCQHDDDDDDEGLNEMMMTMMIDRVQFISSAMNEERQHFRRIELIANISTTRVIRTQKTLEKEYHCFHSVIIVLLGRYGRRGVENHRRSPIR